MVIYVGSNLLNIWCLTVFEEIFPWKFWKKKHFDADDQTPSIDPTSNGHRKWTIWSKQIVGANLETGNSAL